MRRSNPCLLAGAVLALARSGPASAGPPFVTDDPEPAAFQRVELNMAAQATLVKGARGGNFPNLDINYGAASDLQLHFSLFVPLQHVRGAGTAFGYGDTELGVKYRFIAEDEEGWRPQVALYPSLDLPTGRASQGLGSGHDRVYLPLWLQKSVGDWQSFGGGGYWFNRAGDSRDYWFAGWALLNKVTPHWTLGGELFHQSADLERAPAQGGNGISTRASSGFNLGGYYNIDDDRHLMFTFGRGLQNSSETNQFSVYVGYQLIL